MNRRAQRYVELAERCKRTYEAVEEGVYHDPDTLISFDSEMGCLQKLRAEMCRLPIKPTTNGTIALYSKQEMKKGITLTDGSKIVIPSPNLADDVMMSFDYPVKLARHKPNSAPPPRIKMVGRKRR